ncbi:MAG: hypothetical protein IJT00_08500 [Lachnospiraceae bacterium]|nr:hypothetical protein [Lachnospiraceae bacterium]
MLKKADDNVRISLSEARKEIPKMKALFVIQDMTDMSNIQGYITYISESENSYDELINELNKLRKKNMNAMVIGSYENGGAIGVQYCV